MKLDSGHLTGDVLDDAGVALERALGDGDFAVDPAVAPSGEAGLGLGNGRTAEEVGVEKVGLRLRRCALGSRGRELAGEGDEDATVLGDFAVEEEGKDGAVDVENNALATIATVLRRRS